jgi:DTW domain-containing protein YfiP
MRDLVIEALSGSIIKFIDDKSVLHILPTSSIISGFTFMRSNHAPNQDTHCFRCYQRREICICSIIPTVHTHAEFLILRHVYEAERPSNTGRFVALALPNSRIIPCGGGERIGLPRMDDKFLSVPGTCLLWPDGTNSRADKSEMIPPTRVVVIDATWSQARRLFSSMSALWAMPRLALPSPAGSRKRLREQHRSNHMSTLEAVAAAVAKFEGNESAKPLEDLFDELVRRRNSLRWGYEIS